MEYKELKDTFERVDFVNNWMRGEYGFNDDSHCIDMGEVEECLESFRDYMVKLFESKLKEQEIKIKEESYGVGYREGESSGHADVVGYLDSDSMDWQEALEEERIKIRREATIDAYKLFLNKIVEGENHFPNNKGFVIEVNTKEIKEWLEKVIDLTKH